MKNRILGKGLEGSHPLLHRRAGSELQFNPYFVLLKMYSGTLAIGLPCYLCSLRVLYFCVLLCFLLALFVCFGGALALFLHCEGFPIESKKKDNKQAS